MAKIKSIVLTDTARAELEKGQRDGANHGLRQRCTMILLKSENRTSKEVAKKVGCCEVVVNNWLKRYQLQGMTGLDIRAGRGRRAILCGADDLAAVRLAVQKNRQRISHAKAELEKELNREFSTLTLKRFLKKTVASINALDG